MQIIIINKKKIASDAKLFDRDKKKIASNLASDAKLKRKDCLENNHTKHIDHMRWFILMEGY